MEFKRKKKRGLNQKTRRLWLSAEDYRIVWRTEVCGVNVQPAFQASVRIIAPGSYEDGNTEMWDFVEHSKRLYRTMNAAVTACERHYKLWDQAKQSAGILLGHRPPSIPKWVAAKFDRQVSAILLDSTPGRQVEFDDDDEPDKKPTQKAIKKPAKKRKPRSDIGKKRGPRKPKSQ